MDRLRKTRHVDASVQQRRCAKWLRGLTSRELCYPLYGHHRVLPEWKIENLTITEHLIWFIDQNECEGELNGERVVLEAGTLLWLQPGVRFSFRLIRSARPITLFRFRLAFSPARGAPAAPQQWLLARKAWSLKPTMAAVLQELQTQRPWRMERLRGLMLVLFSALFESQAPQAEAAQRLSTAQCLKLQDQVAQQLHHRVTPGQLAEQLRLTLDYFTRLFRRTYGVPPREWIVQERIRLAAQRLSESKVPIGEVAEEFGYPDIFSFSRQFKKWSGLSPRAYRQQHHI